MVNNRKRGDRFERKLINLAREKGYFVMRSAGSHGIADFMILDTKTKNIKFIQAKKGYISEKEIARIYEAGNILQGLYQVLFVVINKQDREPITEI